MPAEARKLSRRRIFALPPTCNRERDSATSHTSALEEVSMTAVTVASGTGVSVGDGAIVGGTVVCVCEGVAGAVGEGIKVAVAVPVGGEMGDEFDVSAVEVNESFVDVKLGDGKGNDVKVDESDGDVAVGEGIGGERVSVTG